MLNGCWRDRKRPDLLCKECCISPVIRERRMQMIISPKWDYCIKELFRNMTVLKYFISVVLEIPVEEIRSVRLLNTFLRRRYRYQKQGILDVLAEMNDNTKINIELQVKAAKEWDKRQLFYLGKMLTEEVPFGKSYHVMKRCVAISILDFNLTEDEKYHKTYLLRDEDGRIFSRLLELHLIELNKVLTGQTIDEWIRFFNAKTQEDLDMLRSQTKSAGILEAIKELEHMSLTRYARMRYEEHLKKIMDRKAQDAYVYDQGVEDERTRLRALISKMSVGEDADKITQLSEQDILEAMMKKYGIE